MSAATTNLSVGLFTDEVRSMSDTDTPTPVPLHDPDPVVTVNDDSNGGPDPAEVKPSWMWIKDSRGYGSVTVTFVTIAFFVTTLAYVLSIVEKIGPVNIRPFDVAACSAYFVPLLTLYFGRKWTEAKHGNGPTS